MAARGWLARAAGRRLAFCSDAPAACRAAPYDSLNLGDHVGDDPRRWPRTSAASRGARRAAGVPEAGARRAAWCGCRPPRAGWRRGRCLLDHRAGVACTVHGRRLPAGAAGRARGPRRRGAHAAGAAGRRRAGSACAAVCDAPLAAHLGAATWSLAGPCIGPDAPSRSGPRCGPRSARDARRLAGASARAPTASGWPTCRPGADRPAGAGHHAGLRQRRQPRLVHRRQSLTVLFAPARPGQRALRRRGLARLKRRLAARSAVARRAPCGRAHQVDHQRHRPHAIEQEGEEGAEHGARRWWPRPRPSSAPRTARR